MHVFILCIYQCILFILFYCFYLSIVYFIFLLCFYCVIYLFCFIFFCSTLETLCLLKSCYILDWISNGKHIIQHKLLLKSVEFYMYSTWREGIFNFYVKKKIRIGPLITANPFWPSALAVAAQRVMAPVIWLKTFDVTKLFYWNVFHSPSSWF